MGLEHMAIPRPSLDPRVVPDVPYVPPSRSPRMAQTTPRWVQICPNDPQVTPRYGSVVDGPSIRLPTRKNSKSRSDFEFFRVRCFRGWSPREGPWEAWEGLGGLGTGFPQLFEHFAKLLKYEPGGGKPTPPNKIFKVSCSETRFSNLNSSEWAVFPSSS